MTSAVKRIVANRSDLRGNGGLRRQRRPLVRNLQRLNRGPSQLLLLKEDQIILGAESEEIDWSGVRPLLRNGLHQVRYQGQEWQVLTEPVESTQADRVAVIRPWSPSVRLVRTLILYQIVSSVIVMALAIFAVAYFSSRLARPLEELRESTKFVGQKELERLEPSVVVEISELQTSFLEMSQRVEEAMASQRRFVADASHELKTPLTAISGMLELLHNRPEMEDEDRLQALSVAQKEAERMGSLISDLLVLSRAQAKRSGTKTIVDLRELVSEQLETLRVLFPEQEFELEGDEAVKIEVNSGAFSRIARNLLENAAHYAGGEPIRAVLKKGQGGGVRFLVVDRGPGIPEEKLGNLFERFYRTDSGRARAAGGHGLGLAIVKALVEEAGGEIKCVSEVGEGSEFQVDFKDP